MAFFLWSQSFYSGVENKAEWEKSSRLNDSKIKIITNLALQGSSAC